MRHTCGGTAVSASYRRCGEEVSGNGVCRGAIEFDPRTDRLPGMVTEADYQMDAVTVLPPNFHMAMAPVMQLRPHPAPPGLYSVDFHNVYRVEEIYRFWPSRVILCTSHEMYAPGADCVAALLRKDCGGLQFLAPTPPSRWPPRLWLWRDRLWQAVRSNHRVTPGEIGRWFWHLCRGIGT